MAIEKIKILDIGRKRMDSKFKPGEFYNMTTVRDQNNRKVTAFGEWADNWKEGDVIEVEIEKKSYKDKEGFDKVAYNAINPKKQQRPFSGSNSKDNVIMYSFLSAAFLAPSVLKEKLNLENYLKLQGLIEEEMRKKVGGQTSSQQTTTNPVNPVKEVSMDEPTKMSEKEKPSTELSDDDVDINDIDIF